MYQNSKCASQWNSTSIYGKYALQESLLCAYRYMYAQKNIVKMQILQKLQFFAIFANVAKIANITKIAKMYAKKI